MPTSRRKFIKQSAGMVALGMVMPKIWLAEARAQAPAAANRRIFVVIQFSGGNDAFNMLVPYTDARYLALRPTLSFKESDLRDRQGRSMIISNEFGLHPAMGHIDGMIANDKFCFIRTGKLKLRKVPPPSIVCHSRKRSRVSSR